MARIRTVKPEFFRDEDLQDLELKHPEARPMLVFAGLWGHCDKQGVFEWKPRVLKLDILPFLSFDMEATLAILEGAKLVEKFDNDGKLYGFIDSFTGHQRIGGKEFSDPAKHPGKNRKQRGSNGEAIGQQLGLQEGKGSGREGKGMEWKGTSAPVDNVRSPEPEDVFGEESAPKDPPSRKNGNGSRRNGDFEAINEAVSKLLASGVCKASDTITLAKLADVTETQAATAVRQLRDRGRLPAVAA